MIVTSTVTVFRGLTPTALVCDNKETYISLALKGNYYGTLLPRGEKETIESATTDTVSVYTDKSNSLASKHRETTEPTLADPESSARLREGSKSKTTTRIGGERKGGTATQAHHIIKKEYGGVIEEVAEMDAIPKLVGSIGSGFPETTIDDYRKAQDIEEESFRLISKHVERQTESSDQAIMKDEGARIRNRNGRMIIEYKTQPTPSQVVKNVSSLASVTRTSKSDPHSRPSLSIRTSPEIIDLCDSFDDKS